MTERFRLKSPNLHIATSPALAVLRTSHETLCSKKPTPWKDRLLIAFASAFAYAVTAERTSAILEPMSAGLSTTWMPHSRMTRFFASADSSSPDTMAPAWPMVRPLGAVTPAMKPPTTGLVPFARIQRAA